MKTVLRIANTDISIIKQLEVVPNIEDWIFAHEPSSPPKDDLPFVIDYDSYCKHQIKSRDWHLYDDHTEASVLIGACSRRDRCVLVPHD